MANEITVFGSMTMQNGEIRSDSAMPNFQDDQANAVYAEGIQKVGSSSHELLDLGDVTTPGWMMLFNNDDTNFVEIGRDDGGTFLADFEIPPKKTFGPVKVASGTTLYVQADTANCNVKRVIFAK